mgnify:FL=1
MSKDEYPFFDTTPSFEDWLALKHREIDAARPELLTNVVRTDRGWRYDSRR